MRRRAQLVVFRTSSALLPVRHLAGAVSVLTVIERNPGLTQTQVAAALGIKRTNFVDLLNELEKRALAERRQVSGDKRSYALYLTPDGASLMRKLRPVLKAHEARMVAKVGEAGRDQLVALLHDVAEASTMHEPGNGAGTIKAAKASRAPRPGSAET